MKFAGTDIVVPLSSPKIIVQAFRFSLNHTVWSWHEGIFPIMSLLSLSVADPWRPALVRISTTWRNHNEDQSNRFGRWLRSRQ
ncbi:MAG: hypothetical protein ABJC66_11925, partial [Gammaproteobacteria bacterium]